MADALMTNCVDQIGPALQAALDCAEQALIDCDRAICQVFISPGAVAWDNCCSEECGGQLWVRVVNVTPEPTTGCAINALNVNAAVGFLRCVHGLTDNGFPTAEQMTGDALSITTDASILLNAISCCPLTSLVGPKTIKVGSGAPLGPDGVCGGWEWNFSFKVATCGGC